MANPPILFLIFNRPDLTAKVFSVIRKAKPTRLFIAADGPRDDHPREFELCAQTRAVVSEIDWECEVHHLYRENNLGCKVAVSEAISWFFRNVESGIILEDDCLPDPSFFPYCAELLERYSSDERIMCISGNNFQHGELRGNASYYYSSLNHIWGWATWRRAWQHYEREMSSWPQFNELGGLKNIFASITVRKYWRDIFDHAFSNNIDTWDYMWTFTCWLHSGLTILPNVNLVSNIGFDERATHTKQSESASSCIPALPIQLPLLHPSSVTRNAIADEFTMREHFGLRHETNYSFILAAKCKLRNAINSFKNRL